VAIEATGANRKPIHNILEGEFDLLVVNAQHVKAVPGCKTDVRADAYRPPCGTAISHTVASR
jgi:hypothetical protein